MGINIYSTTGRKYNYREENINQLDQVDNDRHKWTYK
jgi:hypothetical protein